MSSFEATAIDRPGVRDRILDAATELFYNDGINATGVDLIAARAAVSKRTLYKYFPSKFDVVEQYLQRLVDVLPDPRQLDLDTPRARVLSLFEVPRRGDGRMRGCPFHNAAVEAASTMPEIAAFVQIQKKTFVETIVDLCRDLGTADAQSLGHQIALVYEGAAALSTSVDDVEPWMCARALVESLLDRAV